MKRSNDILLLYWLISTITFVSAIFVILYTTNSAAFQETFRIKFGAPLLINGSKLCIAARPLVLAVGVINVASMGLIHYNRGGLGAIVVFVVSSSFCLLAAFFSVLIWESQMYLFLDKVMSKG